MKIYVVAATTLFATFVAGMVQAAESLEKKGKRHEPPPVAIEACAAAVEGDSCSFEGRHNDTLTGHCGTGREEALACRPDHDRPRLRRRENEQGSETDQESE